MIIEKKRQKGQGLIEFALIIALIAATSMLSLNLMGISIKDVYTSVVNAFTGEEHPCKHYYENSFDDKLDGWTRLKRGLWRGNFNAKDGQLIGGPLGALMLDEYSGSDYVINLENPQLKQTGKTWNGYGVMFRSEYDKYDQLNGYMFEIEREHSKTPGEMYFSKWINGYQVRPPLASIEVPPDFDWNNPGNMTVVAKGDTFQAYINGEKVLEMQDDTYNEGEVGVAVNAGSRLYLDNFGIDSASCKE